jgi:hypothetical protein
VPRAALTYPADMGRTYGRNFWRQTIERAVKTAAQAIGLVLVGDGANVLTLDWQLVGGSALTGAVLSIVTSIATAPVGEPDSPSAVRRTNP